MANVMATLKIGSASGAGRCPSSATIKCKPSLRTAPLCAPLGRHRSLVASPTRQLHSRASDAAAAAPEPEQEAPPAPSGGDGKPSVLGVAFQDVYFYFNIAYWSLLLLSVLTGSDLLGRLTHFETYTTVMFCTSVLFSIFSALQFARDARRHFKSEAARDWRLVLRYSWNAVFWLGFVLWYIMPPVPAITEYTGTAGAIMSLFGIGLALSAALLVGMWSFMGEPQVPRRLVTAGPYLLCRHPQALGNLLFLIGFSVAGGALWASGAFVVALALYAATTIPREEAMLSSAFGDDYRRYSARTPPYRYALLLLLLLEVVLLRRFTPWSAIPIEVVPRPV